MWVKKNAALCSGCGLCASICQQKAIAMVLDQNGFMYPQIDETRCTHCNACVKVCPFQQSNDGGNIPLASYAVMHTQTVREKSSSGGFFTALSDHILSQKGVVYGAVWTDEYAVTHIRADNACDRDRMRSSKYVQSDITGVFSQIKADVAANIPVLFTGTPCQCAAITKMFGGKQPENLYIMDVICHGVMPQPFMHAYLQHVCKKNGKQMTAVNLRDKRFGWQTVGVEFSDGTVYHSEDDYFYQAYAMHALQRPACFSCACAKEARFSDFTAGDFWGIQKNHPELYDDLGVSLVLINSQRARALLSDLGEDIKIVPVRPEDYLLYQPNLRKPTEYGKRAEEFSKYYQKHGYEKTMHRFFDVTLMRKINTLGYSILKKLLPEK